MSKEIRARLASSGVVRSKRTPQVKALEIDGGSGCVAPSAETVIDGTYVPLGRPLLVYFKAASLARPEVKAFAEFYRANQDELTTEALFIPLNDDQKAEQQQSWPPSRPADPDPRIEDCHMATVTTPSAVPVSLRATGTARRRLHVEASSSSSSVQRRSSRWASRL